MSGKMKKIISLVVATTFLLEGVVWAEPERADISSIYKLSTNTSLGQKKVQTAFKVFCRLGEVFKKMGITEGDRRLLIEDFIDKGIELPDRRDLIIAYDSRSRKRKPFYIYCRDDKGVVYCFSPTAGTKRYSITTAPRDEEINRILSALQNVTLSDTPETEPELKEWLKREFLAAVNETYKAFLKLAMEEMGISVSSPAMPHSHCLAAVWKKKWYHTRKDVDTNRLKLRAEKAGYEEVFVTEAGVSFQCAFDIGGLGIGKEEFKKILLQALLREKADIKALQGRRIVITTVSNYPSLGGDDMKNGVVVIDRRWRKIYSEDKTAAKALLEMVLAHEIIFHEVYGNPDTIESEKERIRRDAANFFNAYAYYAEKEVLLRDDLKRINETLCKYFRLNVYTLYHLTTGVLGGGSITELKAIYTNGHKYPTGVLALLKSVHKIISRALRFIRLKFVVLAGAVLVPGLAGVADMNLAKPENIMMPVKVETVVLPPESITPELERQEDQPAEVQAAEKISKFPANSLEKMFYKLGVEKLKKIKRMNGKKGKKAKITPDEKDEIRAWAKRMGDEYRAKGIYNPTKAELEEYCGRLADMVYPLFKDMMWPNFSKKEMKWIILALIKAESDRKHFIAYIGKDGTISVKVLESPNRAFGIAQITDVVLRELGRKAALYMRIIKKEKIDSQRYKKAEAKLKYIYALLFTDGFSTDMDITEVMEFFSDMPDVVKDGKPIRKDFRSKLQEARSSWQRNIRAAAGNLIIINTYIKRKFGEYKGNYNLLRWMVHAYNYGCRVLGIKKPGKELIIHAGRFLRAFEEYSGTVLEGTPYWGTTPGAETPLAADEVDEGVIAQAEGRISRGVASELEVRIGLETNPPVDMEIDDTVSARVMKAFEDAGRPISAGFVDYFNPSGYSRCIIVAKKLFEEIHKIKFNMQALKSKQINVDEKEDEDFYCGGFTYSNIRSRNEFHYAEEIINDAREYDRRYGTDTLAEYLFHEALCHTMRSVLGNRGHYIARNIQKVVFGNNYAGGENALGAIVRKNIDRKVTKNMVRHYIKCAADESKSGSYTKALELIGKALDLGCGAIDVDKEMLCFDGLHIQFVENLKSVLSEKEAKEAYKLAKEILIELIKTGMAEIDRDNDAKARNIFEGVAKFGIMIQFGAIPSKEYVMGEVRRKMENGFDFDKTAMPKVLVKIIICANILENGIKLDTLIDGYAEYFIGIGDADALIMLLSGIGIKTSRWDEILRLLIARGFPYLIDKGNKVRWEEYDKLMGRISELKSEHPVFKGLLDSLENSIHKYLAPSMTISPDDIINDANKGGKKLNDYKKSIVRENVKGLEDIRKIIEGFSVDSDAWLDIFNIIIERIRDFQQILRESSVIDIQYIIGGSDEDEGLLGLIEKKPIVPVVKNRLILNLTALAKNIHMFDNFEDKDIPAVIESIRNFPGEAIRAVRTPVPLSNKKLRWDRGGEVGAHTVAVVNVDADKFRDWIGNLKEESFEDTVWHELIHKVSLSHRFDGSPAIPAEVWRRIAKEAGFIGYLNRENEFVSIEDDNSDLGSFRQIDGRRWIYRESDGTLVNYIEAEDAQMWDGKMMHVYYGKTYVPVRICLYKDKITYAKLSPLEWVAYAGVEYMRNSNAARVHPLYASCVKILQDYLFTFILNDGRVVRYEFENRKKKPAVYIPGPVPQGARPLNPRYEGQGQSLVGGKEPGVERKAIRGHKVAVPIYFSFNDPALGKVITISYSGDVEIILVNSVKLRLEYVYHPDSNGYGYSLKYPLDGIEYSVDLVQGTNTTIGRDPRCNITLSDVHVSRRHLEIELLRDRINIRDVRDLRGSGKKLTQIREIRKAGAEKTQGPAWNDEDRALFAEQVRRVQSSELGVLSHEDLGKVNNAIVEANSRANAGINAERVQFHIADPNKFPGLGIPKKEDSKSVADLVYAIGKRDTALLHIYVTQRYWDEHLSRNPLLLAETIDHEWQENILGRTHRQAAERARLFVGKGEKLSEYHMFVIQRLLEAGTEGITYLTKILEEKRNGRYEAKFRKYIEDRIGYYRCVVGDPITITAYDGAKMKLEIERDGDDCEYCVTVLGEDGQPTQVFAFLDTDKELKLNGVSFLLKGDAVRITGISGPLKIAGKRITIEEFEDSGYKTLGRKEAEEVLGSEKFVNVFDNEEGMKVVIPIYTALEGVKQGIILVQKNSAGFLRCIFSEGKSENNILLPEEEILGDVIGKMRAVNGRRGTFVDIEGAKRLIVIGDLHGNFGNLVQIMLKDDIREGLEQGEVHIVVLGDVIHPGSGDLTDHKVQEDSLMAFMFLARRIKEYPNNVHYLSGNHEFSHLEEWARVTKGDVWQDREFERYLEYKYGWKFIKTFKDFLGSLPRAARVNGKIVLTHAGASGDLADEKQLEELDAAGDGDVDILEDIILRVGERRRINIYQIKRFLECTKCAMLVAGHTPPSAEDAKSYGFRVLKEEAIGYVCDEAGALKQIIVDSQTTFCGYLDLDMAGLDVNAGLAGLIDKDGNPGLKMLRADLLEEAVDAVLDILKKWDIEIERMELWRIITSNMDSTDIPSLGQLFNFYGLEAVNLFMLAKDMSHFLDKLVSNKEPSEKGKFVARVLKGILEKAGKRFELYRRIHKKGIKGRLSLDLDIEGGLDGLEEVVDFKDIIAETPSQLTAYLSGTSVSEKSGNNLIRELSISSDAQAVVSIPEELFLEKVDGNKITYSPGIVAVLERIKGLKVEIRTEDKVKINRILDMLSAQNPDLKGRIEVKGEFTRAGDLEKRENTVYVLSEKQKELGGKLAGRIKNNELKVFCTSSMALYAVLIYGTAMAGVKEMFVNEEYTDDAKSLIRKLEVFGVTKEQIEQILDRNLPLIVISTNELLRQYQIYRATIEVAA